MNIGDYEFSVNYSTSSIRDAGGVYAVLDLQNGRTVLLDVGESGQLCSRLESHPRSDCWQRHLKGTLGYATLYTLGMNADGRRAIEAKLRKLYNPDCGKI